MGKRTNGTGTVRQRKDGTWECRAPAPYNKSFYGKTKTEANKKLKAFMEKVQKERYVDAERITLDEYLNRFIHTVKVNEMKPKSLDTLVFAAKSLIHPHIGNILFGELTTFDVQGMVNDLKKEGYSYSSIYKAFKLISQAYKYGMTVTPPLIGRDPCVGVKLPKNIKREISDISVFSDDEITRICAATAAVYPNGTPRFRYGDGIIILLFTGMRCGELLGLEWKNVDLEARKIYVRGNAITATDWEGDGQIKTIRQTSVKTKQSQRMIPLSDMAYEALLRLKEKSASPYVLATANGTVVQHRNFLRMFYGVQKLAGVEPRGLHTCRHTFASMLFKRGIDAKVVSEILGHADVSITYNIYIHLIQEQKELAVSMLPKFHDIYAS